MLGDVKINDKLYSAEEGWGRVLDIVPGDYPIVMQFEGEIVTFTLDGKRLKSNRYPTLLWDKVEFEMPKKPLPNLKIDAKVLVWNIGGLRKYKRHFKEFDGDGKIVCFAGNGTSWTTCGETNKWTYWEVA